MILKPMNVIYTTSNSFSSLPKGINIANESTRVSEFPISYIELRFIIKKSEFTKIGCYQGYVFK